MNRWQKLTMSLLWGAALGLLLFPKVAQPLLGPRVISLTPSAPAAVTPDALTPAPTPEPPTKSPWLYG